MLQEDAETGIVKWGETGDTFIIFDHIQFSASILLRRFGHGNFTSFVRQLNKYGFRKVKQRVENAQHNSKKFWEFRHCDGHFSAFETSNLANITVSCAAWPTRKSDALSNSMKIVLLTFFALQRKRSQPLINTTEATTRPSNFENELRTETTKARQFASTSHAESSSNHSLLSSLVDPSIMNVLRDIVPTNTPRRPMSRSFSGEPYSFYPHHPLSEAMRKPPHPPR